MGWKWFGCVEVDECEPRDSERLVGEKEHKSVDVRTMEIHGLDASSRKLVHTWEAQKWQTNGNEFTL